MMVSNVNNGTRLIKFVDKKHLIIQSYTQLFFKAATNSHRLRNSLVCQKPADCVQTVPGVGFLKSSN